MDFKAGEVLLIHKPLTWTSFNVVSKLRYHLRRKTGDKKIKVGHAGTLDPLADGLLIICTGKKTKEIDHYMGLEKEYSGTITLGATTPSYDLETEISERFDYLSLTPDMIMETARRMIGEQEQYPPAFSAKRIDGKRAYQLARKGIDVDLKPRQVTISKFDITRVELPEVDFIISCTKGTYIRSIAHDFGRLLQNGAHLTALRRERIGPFRLTDAWSVEEAVERIENSDQHRNPAI